MKWLVLVVIVVLVVVLARMAKRTGPHVSWEQAQQDLAAGKAVVLWKPGCVFCERLLVQLRKNERVTWVNVWKDQAANEAVHAVNDGNELTPTVFVGDQVLRNPGSGQVLEALGAR